jgi:thymidylate synthase (FAD)
MKFVKPVVRLISRPQIDWEQIRLYLVEREGISWMSRVQDQPHSDAEKLVEFAGRLCYRSWEPGLNPNVKMVRRDSKEYLQNILRSAHGSVIENASYSFVIQNVSRIVTHEWVRHRAGTAISQESLRFVRLEDIPVVWLGNEFPNVDVETKQKITELIQTVEELQNWLAVKYNLDEGNIPFSTKKEVTSWMRRWAIPVATDMVWTANLRAIRHIIEVRTATHAEAEIRYVANQVGELMYEECPLLFGDYWLSEGEWNTNWPKV